ncbi:MAG: LysE family translocator [Paracoccaceae bacterium]
MDPALFLSFLAATFVIVVTPGPSVALASAQALRFGPGAALVAVAGDALGSMVHILVAVLGLQMLVAVSGLVLPWMQMLGGLFILWLALGAWREGQPEAAPPPARAPRRVSFWAGFLACVTNPKAIVFFIALFPGFISPAHSVWGQSLVYGAVFIALDAAFILGYALLARQAFTRAAPRRLRLEHVSALGLLVVGVLLLARGYAALPAAA